MASTSRPFQKFAFLSDYFFSVLDIDDITTENELAMFNDANVENHLDNDIISDAPHESDDEETYTFRNSEIYMSIKFGQIKNQSVA